MNALLKFVLVIVKRNVLIIIIIVVSSNNNNNGIFLHDFCSCNTFITSVPTLTKD